MRFKWILYQLSVIVSAIFVAGCTQESSRSAQGYVEGRYTYMATSVSGVLKQLLVTRGNEVRQGDFLFVLEAQPESDIYNAAVENLKQAVDSRDAIAANLEYAKLTFERYKILVTKNAIQQSQLDNARAVYNAYVAQLAQANANIASTSSALAQSKWTTEQKQIRAPVDAIVFDTYYRQGEYTQSGQSVLSLLAPGDIKVIFYVEEPALGFLKLGGNVSVRCDGCDKSYSGKISFISPSAEYTPPVIYSNETNAKLVYRIEAEFAPRDAFNMHPGQPMYVTY